MASRRRNGQGLSANESILRRNQISFAIFRLSLFIAENSEPGNDNEKSIRLKTFPGMFMSEQVTDLLLAWGAGNEAARGQLIPLVYHELRGIAAHYLRYERNNHTLQTSALVNEAYLRLVDQNVPWQTRAQFFGIAAQLMRQVLVDHARTRLRLKRGGGQVQVSLAEAAHLAEGKSADMLALDDALQALSAVDPQQGRIVELRFFAGLTIEETAEVTGLSTATVEREWRAARAWLLVELLKQ